MQTVRDVTSSSAWSRFDLGPELVSRTLYDWLNGTVYYWCGQDRNLSHGRPQNMLSSEENDGIQT